MRRRRKILFLLLMPAIILTAAQIGWPETGLELVCLVYGMPMAVLNNGSGLVSSHQTKYNGKRLIPDRPKQSHRTINPATTDGEDSKNKIMSDKNFQPTLLIPALI
jgi:hypothetical protein